jgi:hypothetical protein
VKCTDQVFKIKYAGQCYNRLVSSLDGGNKNYIWNCAVETFAKELLGRLGTKLCWFSIMSSGGFW